MNAKDYQAKINYLFRDRLYNAMLTCATEILSKKPNDGVFKLYKGIAYLLCNRLQESISLLETLQSDPNVNIASILVLMTCHRKYATVDKEALLDLDSRLKDLRRKATSMALSLAAQFHLFMGKLDKAREYIDRSLRNSNDLADGLAVKGWLELSSTKDYDSALEYFNSALNIDNNYLDAKFGLVQCYKLSHKYDAALAIINKVIVAYPTLIISLEEKMKIQLAQYDWEQSLESASRILDLDKGNIQAIILQIMSLVCKDGKYENAAILLHTLFSEIEKSESTNGELFVTIAQLFSRVCGRNKQVLSETFRFVEKSVQLNPNNVDFLTELGYQHMLSGNLDKASQIFQSMTKSDESSVNALMYLTFCQILEEKAEVQQLDLLYEIQGSKTPVLLLMTAKMFRNKPEKALSNLYDAFEMHMEQCKTLPYGSEYLRFFDPDFLLMLVEEYMNYCPQKSLIDKNISSGDFSNGIANRCLLILKTITKSCPGSIQALYMLSKVQFQSGDGNAAIDSLNNILKNIDPSYTEAYLLLALIYVQQGLFQRASQALEMGVSYNFHVRDSPIFYLTSGIIEKQKGNIEETIKNFILAMEISGSENKNKSHVLSLVDKVSMYIELAEAYNLMNQKIEAQKIIQDAMYEFKGTSEESRIVIATAEIAEKNEELDTAFELLESVKPDSSYYLQAHTKLANLYLHKRRNRSAFTNCFREVVEHCPGAETFVLLGDAYMSILELDYAIEAYRQALQQKPNNTELARKMGNALVNTFRFDEALTYYKEAVKNPDNITLKFDLAELYVQLERYKDAEGILTDESFKNKNEDLDSLMLDVKRLLILVKVKEKIGDLKSALGILKETKDIQTRVQRRMVMEQSDGVATQKQILCEIYVHLAELCKSLRDNNQAIQYYKEALAYNSNDPDILVALAKLYMQLNILEQCEQTCATILKKDPDNEAACIIMADLAFRKVDFDTAMHHFKQLLVKQPTYWTALARLVEVARRTGKLLEIPQYLTRADEHCSSSNKDAGFYYASALFDWYSGNLNGALKNFNRARLDAEWGQQSIYNMIEICLNPDDDILGEDAFSDILENVDSREMALEMAERLHKELKPRSGGLNEEALNHRLLKNFILIATKQKHNIERALQDFTALAGQEELREHAGLILGLSSSYVLLKQTQRARNHLKRVIKVTWTFEDAEYLERCWLLLADSYIQSGKYDMANDLLKRVLHHNKSCVKAYEYAGFIAEKEQNYNDAAVNYNNAWKFCGKSKPAVGYKLAYSHMKCKHYADAMEICYQVLKEYPNYPKIKKDVLDKARNNLRT